LQRQSQIKEHWSTNALERQIDEVCEGIANVYKKNMLRLPEHNIKTIVDYIHAIKTETSLSTNYRRDIIEALTRLNKFVHDSQFKDLTRDDIVAFLDSYRKPESVDPMHRWIGTYNIYRAHLLRFFKWLYYPDIEHKKRPKPAVMINISELHRKEKSVYTSSDLWTAQDDLLFLKYCPTKRSKAYHAVSRDLSCRPHELLKLKIKDIQFKFVGNRQYVEVTLNGKTGNRTIPLINSVPYLKDYLDHEHPMPSNPNAPLICGTGKSLGRHLGIITLGKIYMKYRKEIFPKMLENPNVLPEDKPLISELLKKPWNPYIRRHSALTEKSLILKEHVLRIHAGWTKGSDMPEKYLHYFGNESSQDLLEAYGLVDHGIQIDQLRPKICPMCNEGNKPDAKFCDRCKMVLSYDAYQETIEKQKQFESDMREVHDILSDIKNLKKKLERN
jgi:integrase